MAARLREVMPGLILSGHAPDVGGTAESSAVQSVQVQAAQVQSAEVQSACPSRPIPKAATIRDGGGENGA